MPADALEPNPGQRPDDPVGSKPENVTVTATGSVTGTVRSGGMRCATDAGMAMASLCTSSTRALSRVPAQSRCIRTRPVTPLPLAHRPAAYRLCGDPAAAAKARVQAPVRAMAPHRWIARVVDTTPHRRRAATAAAAVDPQTVDRIRGRVQRGSYRWSSPETQPVTLVAEDELQQHAPRSHYPGPVFRTVGQGRLDQPLAVSAAPAVGRRHRSCIDDFDRPHLHVPQHPPEPPAATISQSWSSPDREAGLLVSLMDR